MQSFLRKCLLVFLFLLSLVCSAQDSTYVLKDVEIVGIDLSRFSAGTVVTSIKKLPNGALSSIGETSPIYFKNYGSQQLSTISLRGTSASHTSVIWNGVPVNSPTLGQTDFSVWPIFLTDQVMIQYGGGSSLFGSGAIGGTVITDNSRFVPDSLVTLYLGYGSFAEKNAGLKVCYSHGDLSQGFSAYGSGIENNFKQKDGTRQDHASVGRLGFSHKLNYSYPKGRVFTEVAYVANDREIQPTKTSTSRNTLISKNLRAVVNHVGQTKNTQRSTFGFISDQTIYNDSLVTTSYRMMASHGMEKAFGQWGFIRYGAMGVHEWAHLENFEGVKRRLQGHLFASGTLAHFFGSVTVNLRETIYQGEDVFVPSLGFESNSIGNKVSVRLRGQASRDYRLPTFNDLFWKPGGNPDLRSERSMNYEVGTDVDISSLQLSLTAFSSHITDWIQWQPRDGIWSPDNIRRVHTKGLEVNANTKLSMESIVVSLTCAYTYVLSSDKGLGYANQLPYVPRHAAVVSATLTSNNTLLRMSGNYTGKRFTTLTNSRAGTIDSFLLMDMHVAHSFIVNQEWMLVGFTIKNIANTDYENLKNTAMPGRAFLIELTTKI